MNFRQFAYRNVLRNMRAYFAYYLSITLSSALFFLFTMFMFHPSLHKNEFTSTIQSALFTTEIVAYVFLVFFVFYSVSVFLKGRFNEFGTLFILGISKLQLNRLIFLENIIISTMASVSGIILGVVFAKFFLVLTSNLLVTTVFNFYIPTKAIVMTFIAFLILAVLVSILSIFIVKENQILKLLKGTKAAKKEPKLSIIFSLISIGAFSWGYYTAATATMYNVGIVFLPVTGVVILATYLLYSQVSVFIIKLLKKNRKFYLRKINLLWVSDLFYRIKDNARMFFLITITSAVAFTAIGSIYAYMIDLESSTEKLNPQAFYYSKATFDKKDISNLDFLEKSLKEEKINFYKAYGRKKAYKVKGRRSAITLISQSDYNALAISYNMDEISLKNGELFYADIDEDGSNEKQYKIESMLFKVVGNSGKKMFPSFNGDTYAIEDEMWNKIKSVGGIEAYYSYYIDNWKPTLNIANKLSKRLDLDVNKRYGSFAALALNYDYNKKTIGVVLFLVLFIGLIFFITTGSFLYNKFYIDALEDRKKYKSLTKIGLTEKELYKILTIEIGVLFLIPYFVAVIHSSFALRALNSSMGIPVTESAFMVMGSFFMIQVLYFIVIRAFYIREIKNYIA